MIGSLLREIDFGKKDTLSKLLAKAPNPKDVEIKERITRLRNFRNYGPGNGGNLSPLLSPPPPPPPPLLPPNVPGDDFQNSLNYPQPPKPHPHPS